MANWLWFLEIEVSAPSQACLNGNGRIGPAFLEVPPAILREACNAVRRFFRIAFKKSVDTLEFPLFSLDAISLKKWPFFRLNRRDISENALLLFCLNMATS